MSSTNENRDRMEGTDPASREGDTAKQEKTTLNLDTGEVEPLEDLEDKNIMDFGAGSGGGSGTTGGAS